MLLLFPFILIASFLGKVKGGNVIYKICTFWADVWLFLIGVHHLNIYEAPHDFSGQFIFVSNHISYFDIPALLKALRNHPVRVLGKSELTKIPIFGTIYKRAVVMVDRKDAEQRAKSVMIMKSVLKKNISVCIFPEGTFNETGMPLKSFFDGAFRMAIETGIPIKPIVLLDTYNRLNYRSVFSLTPGKSRAVFLPQTNTAGLTPDKVSFLKEKIFTQMEETLVRYKAAWINKEAKELLQK